MSSSLFNIFLTILLCVIVLWLKLFINKCNQTHERVSVDREAFHSEDCAFEKHLQRRQTSGEPCTGDSLRVCNVGDLDSCSSCSNPYATCVHFSQQGTFVDSTGKEVLVPKNAHESEGYCLAAKIQTKTCNALHGNLILVERDFGGLSNQFHTHAELACECKNPGYIGGHACETPFVCGGKVRDINVPFSELECICAPGTTFRRQGGVPTCVESTLQDDDWVGVLRQQQQLTQPISRSVLASSFGDKNSLQGFQQISNPCGVCPITQQLVHGKAVNTSSEGENFECVTNGNTPWFGVPVRLHSGSRLLAGTAGPDAVLAISYKSVFIYGKINEQERATYVVVFDYEEGKNEKFYEALHLDKQKEYFIRSTNHEFVWPGSFQSSGDLFDDVPFFECYPFGVIYKCMFTQGYHITGQHGWEYEGFAFGNESNPSFLRETPSHAMYTAQYKAVSRPPGYYLWGLDDWKEVARFEKPFQFEQVKGRELLTQMVEPDVYRSLASKVSRSLKYLYAAVHREGNWLTFYLGSENDSADNWKSYMNHVYK